MHEKLIQFLYLLVRDHLKAGDLYALVDRIVDKPVEYSSDPLRQLAAHVAARLDSSPRSQVYFLSNDDPAAIQGFIDAMKRASKTQLDPIIVKANPSTWGTIAGHLEDQLVQKPLDEDQDQELLDLRAELENARAKIRAQDRKAIEDKSLIKSLREILDDVAKRSVEDARKRGELRSVRKILQDAVEPALKEALQRAEDQITLLKEQNLQAMNQHERESIQQTADLVRCREDLAEKEKQAKHQEILIGSLQKALQNAQAHVVKLADEVEACERKAKKGMDKAQRAFSLKMNDQSRIRTELHQRIQALEKEIAFMKRWWVPMPASPIPAIPQDSKQLIDYLKQKPIERLEGTFHLNEALTYENLLQQLGMIGNLFIPAACQTIVGLRAKAEDWKRIADRLTIRRDGMTGERPKEDPLTYCQAGKDGDCNHPQCPQNRDGEPDKTGRSCPLLRREDPEA